MKTNILKIIKSISLILLLIYFTSFIFILLNINLNTITEKEYLIYLSLSNLILLIIYLYIYKDTITQDIKNYIKNFSKNFEISFKYWFIGFLIMIISNVIITYILKMTIADNEKIVRNYIDTSPILMIFMTCIYAPICEELTFRKSIKDAIKNKWLYILTSGIIFGLLHIISAINTPLDLLYLIPYSSLGITFAMLYHKTNNIFSTITMHAMHNTLSILTYLLLGGLI